MKSEGGAPPGTPRNPNTAGSKSRPEPESSEGPTPSAAMLDWALAYAKAGTAVFPCKWWPGRGSKAPLVPPPGFHLATTDPTDSGLVDRWPDALIGSPVPTRTCVLDLDPRNGGTIEALTTAFGAPPTHRVRDERPRRWRGATSFTCAPRDLFPQATSRRCAPASTSNWIPDTRSFRRHCTRTPRSRTSGVGRPDTHGSPKPSRVVLAPSPSQQRVSGRPNAGALAGILRRVAEEKDSRNDLLYWAPVGSSRTATRNPHIDAITAAAQHAGLSPLRNPKTINSARKALA